MIEDMQVLNLAPQTQSTYLLQVSLFAHFGKSAEDLTFQHIRDYQVHLVREKKLASSSVVVAVSALRFLYRKLASGDSQADANDRLLSAFVDRGHNKLGVRKSETIESFDLIRCEAAPETTCRSGVYPWFS